MPSFKGFQLRHCHSFTTEAWIETRHFFRNCKDSQVVKASAWEHVSVCDSSASELVNLLVWDPVAEHILGLANHLLIAIHITDSFVMRMLWLALAVRWNDFGRNPIAEQILGPANHFIIAIHIADSLVMRMLWLDPANAISFAELSSSLHVTKPIGSEHEHQAKSHAHGSNVAGISQI